MAYRSYMSLYFLGYLASEIRMIVSLYKPDISLHLLSSLPFTRDNQEAMDQRLIDYRVLFCFLYYRVLT
jgi:hypothetical protein